MTVTEDKEIDLFVASKIGSFKHIKYHTDETRNSKKYIENLIDIKSLNKGDGITCMAWSNKSQTEMLIGKKDQKIFSYNTEEDTFPKVYSADFGTGDIVGVGKHHRKIIAALSSGVVKVWSKKGEYTLDTGGKLDRMRLCPDDSTLFCTGGQENDLKVWKIGEMEAQFSAKNLPNDWLQLRRLVWVSDACFLKNEGGRILAVSSRHGYVRLYDTRVQRRPVCNVDFETNGMAATCIAPSFGERQVLVGFGRGHLHQVDLRQKRSDKGYKGSTGALTDISTIESERLIVSTSLDRWLKIHDYDSKQLVYKQYLTSKLTNVLVQTASSTALRKEPKDEIKEEEIVEQSNKTTEDLDEMDELFNEMENVGDKPKNKRQIKEKSIQPKKFKPSSLGSTTIDMTETPIESSIIENLDTDDDAEQSDSEEAIKKLLKSTEKKKRGDERKKKEKKKKSVFHNA